jgi:hypothetical protein
MTSRGVRLKAILEARGKAACAPSFATTTDGSDPLLVYAFATFDAANEKMIAFQTLEKRRTAAKVDAPRSP